MSFSNPVLKVFTSRNEENTDDEYLVEFTGEKSVLFRNKGGYVQGIVVKHGATVICQLLSTRNFRAWQFITGKVNGLTQQQLAQLWRYVIEYLHLMMQAETDTYKQGRLQLKLNFFEGSHNLQMLEALENGSFMQKEM